MPASQGRFFRGSVAIFLVVLGQYGLGWLILVIIALWMFDSVITSQSTGRKLLSSAARRKERKAANRETSKPRIINDDASGGGGRFAAAAALVLLLVRMYCNWGCVLLDEGCGRLLRLWSAEKKNPDDGSCIFFALVW